MGAIERVRVEWTGFPGQPGISTFYFRDASFSMDALHAFYGTICDFLPSDVQINFPVSGDILDDETGVIAGTWTTGARGALDGVNAGNYAAPSGFSVRWVTLGIHFGRRLRGRTYFVPMSASWYQDDGTLLDTLTGPVDTAAALLLSTVPGQLVVWSRPQDATPSWTDVHGTVHAAKAARSGTSSLVVGHSVPDKTVVLRSRRD